MKLLNNDCLDVYQTIEPGSVDLILCDPPYGTIKGLKIEGYKNRNTEWDDALNPKSIFEIANHTLRQNGKIILFSQEPYTSKLIQSSFENIKFCYRMIWKKDHFANGLMCKKAPVSYIEDIIVFTKKHDTTQSNPLRTYFKNVLEYIDKPLKEINHILGHRRAEHSFYITSTQFKLCTSETYQELIDVFQIQNMTGFIDWNNLNAIHSNFKSTFKSTFNLPSGQKIKSNILEYSKDYTGFHPTQKPVALLEDLVLTYTNQNDIVFDFTMGSGSTAIACINQNRRFIGIEKDENFFKIASERITAHQTQFKLFNENYNH